MNNFEKIKSLSIEEMARLNVKCFLYMRGYSPVAEFHTTDSNIFDTREEAEEYELNWLKDKCNNDTFDVLIMKK